MEKRERDISIDLLKFLAVLFITNSHFGALYPERLSMLATGGAIGDVLFFFCSGYTLFLGRSERFDNWYKRRINRIYPTVFAWAIIAAFCFGMNTDMRTVVLHGGGWFVSCIMIYYVLLYPIRNYATTRRRWLFVLTACLSVILLWYVGFYPDKLSISIYGETYFKWGFYFLFMLMGAMVGQFGSPVDQGWKKPFCMTIIYVSLFYGFMIFAARFDDIARFQVLTLLPLAGIVYHMWRFMRTPCMDRIYRNRIGGVLVKTIGGLCLEVYICQGVLLSGYSHVMPQSETLRSIQGFFPLNIVLMLCCILVLAYVLRCCARIFSQTFGSENYNWSKVFEV